MLNLSSILDGLTEEQMDRVLEFKAGWNNSHGKSSKGKSRSKSKSKSKGKSCSWKSGHK